MRALRRILLLLVVFSVFPLLAHAHPGHEGHDLTWDFAAGLGHPLTGWDHLLAMAAVGAWASVAGGRSRWLIPITFLATLVLGALLAQSGIMISGVEQAIAASILVLGLILGSGARLPMAAGLILTSGFALFHGLAHGAEVPAAGNGLSFGLGFVLTTALLHLAGMGFGEKIRTHRTGLRLTGGLLAGLGVLALALA